MKKQYLLLMLVLSSSAFAKVTYDDAVNSSSDYHNSNEEQSLSPRVGFGLGPDELQDSSGVEWKHVWSGSTTGRINIPSTAKEVFVVTSTDKIVTFPKNSNVTVLDSASNSKAVAKVTFNGNSVSGETKTVTWLGECASENHTNCRKSATATIGIKKVMVK